MERTTPESKNPDSTGLVGLSINGSVEKSPVIDDSGFLWLSNQNAGKSDEKAENRMDVKIFRLFEDNTPLEVTTMIQVSVSGDVRRKLSHLKPCLRTHYQPQYQVLCH